MKHTKKTILNAVYKVKVDESYVFVRGIILAIKFSKKYNGDFDLIDYSKIATNVIEDTQFLSI